MKRLNQTTTGILNRRDVLRLLGFAAGGLTAGFFLSGCRDKNEGAELVEPLEHISSQGKLAFSVESPDNQSQYNTQTALWIANSDGTDSRKIADNISKSPVIKFSPNGRYVLFEDKERNLKISDLEGNVLNSFKGNNYSWINNGDSILYTNTTPYDGTLDPDGGLFIYNMNTQQSKKIYSSAKLGISRIGRAVISPDEKNIAFLSRWISWDRSLNAVHIMDSSGNNERKVIEDNMVWEGYHKSLIWINNEKILFGRGPQEGTSNLANEISIYDYRTMERKNITFPISFLYMTPSFDNQNIALYTRDELYFTTAGKLLSGFNDLSSMNEQLLDTTFQGDRSYVAWSRDGNYFALSGSQVPRIFDNSFNQYSLVNQDFIRENDFVSRVEWFR